MAKKLSTRQHIENLEAMCDQGAEKDDILQYMAEQKISKAEAEQIRDFINQPTGANVLRQALGQGALLGFGDEIEGGIMGLMPGTTVDKEIDRARQRVKMYEENYPERAIPATLAGGVLTGGVGTARAAALKGAPMLARMAQGAKTGAGYGAVGGAGTAEGGLADRAVGAGYGTLTGAGTGAAFPAIAAGGRAVVDAARGSMPGAAKRIAERNVREAAEFDDITADVARDTFARGPDVMAGADLADPRAMGLRNAARLAANTRGGVQGLRFVGERADAQGQRIGKALEGGLPSKTLDDFLDETNELRRVSANRNYGKFYDNPVQLDDKLKNYFADEDFQEAYKLAQTIARREGVSIPPLFEMVDGNKVFAQPNARMLDYIKQGMDALVDRTYRNEGGTLGKSLQKVRDAYRDHLDELMPDYPKARSEYAGLSAAMEAAELGEKFILNPRKIGPNIFKRMGDHEKEAFRVGVAEALRMKINTSPDGTNIVRKIFGNPDARERLQLAFGNDEAFDAFRKTIEAEAKMAATGTRVLGVSSTAPMMADQKSLTELGARAFETMSGDPMTALTRAAMAMKGGPASDDIAAETRALLLDPSNQARLLQVLAEANPVLQRRMGRITPTVGNVLAGQSPRINPLLPQ
tara:strand:- start:485 stop:2401 length:1917 start_codon:yes stop_codon:yes gene_type:complete